MSNAPQIETVPLGDHVLLHNPASGALILSEPSATGLLAASSDMRPSGLRPDEAQILETWREAGLFETRRRDPEACLPRSSDAGKQRLVYRGRAGTIAILTPDQPLIDQLNCMLELYRADPALPADRTYVFEADDDRYTAYDADTPITEHMTRDEARFLGVRFVCEGISGHSKVAATFHAAAVAQGGRALILVGESGQGKTTTALGLLGAGCVQVADDHLPLHLDGRSVLAFPTAIGTKAGTWPLPEAQALFATAREMPPVRDGVRYVLTDNHLPQGEAVRVAGFVFPNHTPGAALEVQRISPEEAFVTSVQGGARVSPALGVAGPLAQLCNHVPAWRVTYETSAQSVPACLQLLDA